DARSRPTIEYLPIGRRVSAESDNLAGGVDSAPAPIVDNKLESRQWLEGRSHRGVLCRHLERGIRRCGVGDARSHPTIEYLSIGRRVSAESDNLAGGVDSAPAPVVDNKLETLLRGWRVNSSLSDVFDGILNRLQNLNSFCLEFCFIAKKVEQRFHIARQDCGSEQPIDFLPPAFGDRPNQDGQDDYSSLVMPLLDNRKFLLLDES